MHLGEQRPRRGSLTLEGLDTPEPQKNHTGLVHDATTLAAENARVGNRTVPKVSLSIHATAGADERSRKTSYEASAAK